MLGAGLRSSAGTAVPTPARERQVRVDSEAIILVVGKSSLLSALGPTFDRPHDTLSSAPTSCRAAFVPLYPGTTRAIMYFLRDATPPLTSSASSASSEPSARACASTAHAPLSSSDGDLVVWKACVAANACVNHISHMYTSSTFCLDRKGRSCAAQRLDFLFRKLLAVTNVSCD